MSLFLCFLCLVAPTPSLAGEKPQLPGTMHLYFENDFFTRTDRNYSFGSLILFFFF